MGGGISTSTLLIFVFILPGFVFVQGVVSGSRLRLPLIQGNLILDVCFFLGASIVFNVISIEIYFDWWLLPHLGFSFMPDTFLMKDASGVGWSISSFIYSYKIYVMPFILFVVLLSFFSGFFLIVCNNTGWLDSHFYYGNFYPLISGTFPLIRADVMTRVSHEGKILMYSGIVEDVIFSSDKSINSIFLLQPDRFFMDLTKNVPQIMNGLSLEQHPLHLRSVLYIKGEDIENVYFQRLNASGSSLVVGPQSLSQNTAAAERPVC